MTGLWKRASPRSTSLASNAISSGIGSIGAAVLSHASTRAHVIDRNQTPDPIVRQPARYHDLGRTRCELALRSTARDRDSGVFLSASRSFGPTGAAVTP